MWRGKGYEAERFDTKKERNSRKRFGITKRTFAQVSGIVPSSYQLRRKHSSCLHPFDANRGKGGEGREERRDKQFHARVVIERAHEVPWGCCFCCCCCCCYHSLPPFLIFSLLSCCPAASEECSFTTCNTKRVIIT